ncbi:MAG: tetratricopeptide repeat-containing sensor histidine kinase [Raineya sp.]|jgi:signal transduction histidine kinase|nr:tetratricopeptide repeat-containing sensor histidine kinase [Raineya sp.]
MKLWVVWIFLLIYVNQSYAQTYNIEETYQHLKSTNDYVLQHHLLEQFVRLSSKKCDYTHKLKSLISKDKNLDIALAIVLILEADECYEGNSKQQEQLREKALQLIRSSKDPCFEAFISSRIAYGHFSNAPFNSNIDYLQPVKFFIEQNPCEQYQYVVPEINYLIFSKQGKNDLALKEILEAELLYKKFSSLKGFGWVLLQKNLGFIFYQTKNYSEALKHWNQSLNAIEKFSIKTRVLINSHNDIGLAYKHIKNYEQSLIHFSKAIEIAKEIKDSVWIGIPQGNIAEILIEQKKYEQAIIYLKNYLDFASKFKEHGIIVAAYTKLAITNYKQKNIPEALRLLDLGETHLKKYENEIYKVNPSAFLEHKRKLYSTYVEILEDIQEYSKAFFYQKKYQETIETINLTFNKEKIAEIEGFYKFKEQETENSFLKQQAKNRENEIFNQRIVIFATSLIALISIVGGIYMFTYFKLRKKYIKNLEYVNNFKSKIFSVVSHDLRGYMSSLKGFVYLIRNQNLDKKDLDIITEELSKNTEYTSDLMDNLLLWAKSQLEGQNLKVENHFVKEIIVETIFEVGWFSNNKKISIDMDVSENLIVSADKNVFEIALRNLLTNAIKFTKIGGSIWVKAVQSDKYCEVSVTDTGVGISPEDLEKIRNGISITNKGTQLEKGIGLGLVLCRDSIQESGGKFYIESSLGKGTTVKFSLPLATPSQTKNNIMQNSSINTFV